MRNQPMFAGIGCAFLLAAILLNGCASSGSRLGVSGQGEILRSPDGRIEISVTAEGGLRYAVAVDGQAVILPSQVGLRLRAGANVAAEGKVIQVTRRRENSTWKNRLGKRSTVINHYNELRVVLRDQHNPADTLGIVFRAFNEGLGFRYELSGTGPCVIEQELTEFAFAGDYECYAGQHNPPAFPGPQEWEFKPGKLSGIKPASVVGLPLLVHAPAAWVAVTEADLRDWSGMWLGGATNTAARGVDLIAKLAPRRDKQGLVMVEAPHASPWRVLMIGREPGRLIESDLVLNLSTPCQLADTSWIRPGKMAWDHWWTGDVKMDTGTLKEYIQLASDMGWPYQLIDAEWYLPYNKTNADITLVNSTVDMDEVRRFAREKGVRLWLWMHWTDVDRHDAYKKAFPLYEQWGIAGVKIDFMDRDNQEMVNWYEKITRAAAEHHLLVDFHGAFKTSGFNRTFPNQITREGILGNEYNRWSARVTPQHKLTLPFTRFLAGPADFTPGGFLNRQPGQFKADPKAAEVQGTRCSELALFVLYDSPVCCICDRPSHYYNQPGTDFLKVVPTTWDETRVLEGEVGKRLVMARRSGRDWYVGAMTDTNACDLNLSLSFLKKGNWKVQIWKDALDSDQNAEHLETEQKSVITKDTLSVHLAPAGGWVARFSPGDQL